MTEFWQRGEMKLVAEAAGISASHFSEMLHRKRPINAYTAKKLEEATEKVLGSPIPWTVWVFSLTSKHPALKGEPVNV